MFARILLVIVVGSLALAGCLPGNTPGVDPTPLPQPTATAELPTLPPTSPLDSPTPPPATLPPANPAPTEPVPTAAAPTGAPAASPTPPPGMPAQPEEAILILAPGPGSRLPGPIRVAGEANSTFEQNLVVRVVNLEGEELALTPTTIQAELGQRGPFEALVEVPVSEATQVFIQVYSDSPRDGGITHLAAVGVTLAPGEPEDIRPVEAYTERITIFQPGIAAQISGGVLRVEGFALASFEQHLTVEVLDADGNVVGMQPVTVQAPDLGQPGPFSVDVPYTVSAAGPGRVVVRDPSPAFPGDVHLASVEVQLAP